MLPYLTIVADLMDFMIYELISKIKNRLIYDEIYL